jgi:Divergent InlB B-repeat domain
MLVACGGGGGGGGGGSDENANTTMPSPTPATAPPASNVAPNVIPSFTLNLSTLGNGNVTSQPAGINCGATCSASFAENNTVTLTATPATGQVFSSWTGDCTGSGAVCSLNMSAGRTASAVFQALSMPMWQTQTTAPGPNDEAKTYLRNTSVAADGSVLTAWVAYEEVRPSGSSAEFSLKSSRYIPGSGWSAPVVATQLGLRSTIFRNTPQSLATSPNGRAIYAWTVYAGDDVPEEIRAISYNPSTGWSSVSSVVSLGATTYISDIKAGIDDRGNGFVLLQKLSRSSMAAVDNNVLTSRYINGRLETPQLFSNTTITQSDRLVGFAAMSNGNALAVWRGSNDDAFNGYWSSVFNSGSLTWAAPTRIVAGSFGSPVLAANNTSAILTWVQGSGITGRVMSLQFSNEVWQSTPTTHPSVEKLPTSSGPVAINAQGTAIVYLGVRNKNPVITRSRADGSWEPPQEIKNPLPSGSPSFPYSIALGIADNGDALAVWNNASFKDVPVPSGLSGMSLANTTITIAGPELLFSRYTGTEWSTPETIVNINGDNFFGRYELTHNGRGDAMFSYWSSGQLFTRYLNTLP